MKKIKFLAMLLMAMTLSFAFTSCSDDDDDAASIIGTWHWEDEYEWEEIEFSAAGTFTQSYGSYSQTNNRVYTIHGIYSFDAGKRLLSMTDSNGETEYLYVESLTSKSMKLRYVDDTESSTYVKL